MPIRSAFLWLFAALLLPCVAACGPNGRRNRSADAPTLSRLDSAAPYQAEIDEGLGAAVAILVDTSGSMRNDVPGESRPKYIVAREALEAMLDATDDFVARRPDFPIKIGVYSFSSSVSTVSPIQRVIALDASQGPVLASRLTLLNEGGVRPACNDRAPN